MLKMDKIVPLAGLMEDYLIFASTEEGLHVLPLVFYTSASY